MMDSQKRDETREQRREEALARRVGLALDRLVPGDSHECPDAELIAAYHERALEPDEQSRCESHFATCARCRKILAVLAASADIDTPLAEAEVARLGELVAAARTPHEAAPRMAKPIPANRWDWRARWLAPAFGVAAVLAVWFAIRPPWRVTNQGSPGTLIAQSPKSESSSGAAATSMDQLSNMPPVSKTPPAIIPETSSATPSARSSATLKDQTTSKSESSKPLGDTLAMSRSNDGAAVGGLAPSPTIAPSVQGNDKKEKADVDSAAVASAPPTPAVPMRTPLAQAQSGSTAQDRLSTPEVSASGSQSGTVTGAVPTVETPRGTAGLPGERDKQVLGRERQASNLPLNDRNFQALSKLDMPAGTAVQIKAPSGRLLWRIGNKGRIERSSNAGNVWTLQTSPSQEEWLSGAAVSEKICWIVGRNGAIARTTDSDHWEKIAPPPMSAGASGKFPDWINVTASSAESAVVTANDQRRYATQDGGKTWSAQ